MEKNQAAGPRKSPPYYLHSSILSSLGLLSRGRAKRIAVKDITYNRDGTVADVTMYCGHCKGHYVYEEGRDIPDTCPECHNNNKWRIAIRYLQQ